MLIGEVSITEVQEVDDYWDVKHQVVAHGIIINNEAQEVC